MWKVVIVVCALGNPCIIMEEDPMRYYNNKNECIANAATKHDMIVDSYSVYGYNVQESRFDCVEKQK